jgi:hypothetical protein
LTLPEILELSNRLDKQARVIKKEALQICWYMRGMSYTEVMNLSHEEREIVGEIIKENLETTKKTGMPFF